MTDAPARPETPSMVGVLGMLLVRVVVPAWIIAGAAFKTYEAAPRYLPATSVRGPASDLRIDLMWLLLVIVIVEFIIAGAMILFARAARPLAILILSAFCVVLIVEMASGQSSCGCFGTKSPPPWQMLIIDGAMLLGTLFLRPWPATFGPPALRVTALAAIAAFSGVMAWNRIEPGAAVVADGGGEVVDAGPTVRMNPDLQPVPQYWLSENLGDLVGRPWTEFELFDYMEQWPSVPDVGTRYVVFYGLNCEHCEGMFKDHLTMPELARMTTAVLVPFGKDERAADGAWTMMETECELLELPLGADWIMTTPVTLRIEDGMIAAIQEGDHLSAMEFDADGNWTGGDGAAAGAGAEPNGAEPATDDAGAEVPAPAAGTPDVTGAAPRANPNPLPLPQYWLSDPDALAALDGTRWEEFELVRYMPTLPSVPDTGVHYVTFYGRNCEHCEGMFQDFVADPDLASKVTAVLVPFGKNERMAAGSWALPVTDCELLELPLGVDWIMTTPLTIRVEDGRITCAEEEDHARCMDL